MEPFEKGDRVAGLRVIAGPHRGHYQTKCYKCRLDVTVAASMLRMKRCGCQRCFRPRRQPPSQVYYTLRGLPTVDAA
jgi:hypothetical protein